MPLILISGFPCSGKSTRASELASYFTSRITTSPPNSRLSKLRVHIVSSPLLTTRSLSYADARSEKETRAAEMSAIKRLLGRDDVVIADAPNYIKGFRYQLFCEAKALSTPSCVVHVAAPADRCKEWNATRRDERSKDSYSDELLENLVFRYEEPNGMARWDSPLFVVPWMDTDITVDCDKIWEAMVSGGVVAKPNQATILRPAVEGNYLQELDKVTKGVVGQVSEHIRAGGTGGLLPIDGCDEKIVLPEGLALAVLQRLRRQFIQLNRQHVAEKERVRELFVNYINENIN